MSLNDAPRVPTARAVTTHSVVVRLSSFTIKNTVDLSDLIIFRLSVLVNLGAVNKGWSNRVGKSHFRYFVVFSKVVVSVYHFP